MKDDFKTQNEKCAGFHSSTSWNETLSGLFSTFLLLPLPSLSRVKKGGFASGCFTAGKCKCRFAVSVAGQRQILTLMQCALILIKTKVSPSYELGAVLAPPLAPSIQRTLRELIPNIERTTDTDSFSSTLLRNSNTKRDPSTLHFKSVLLNPSWIRPNVSCQASCHVPHGVYRNLQGWL